MGHLRKAGPGGLTSRRFRPHHRAAPSSGVGVQFLVLAAFGVAAALTTAAAAADLSEPPEYDPAIAAILAEVDESELRNTTCDLQNFSTRAFGSAGNREAGEYLYGRLDGIPGLLVEFQGGDLRNVVATLPGSDTASDGVVVVGAHYDSRSFDPGRAPGVTDNGCGVAIVLELARVMSRHSFDRTVQFALWNAEENGRQGSRRYLQAAAGRTPEILLYLNYDSTCRGHPDRPVANLLFNREARGTATLMVHHNALYGTNFTLTRRAGPYVSDHISFWGRGYPAIMAHALPQWPAHTPDDTVERASFRYAEKNAQPGLSVLARVAEMQEATPLLSPVATSPHCTGGPETAG